MVHLLLETRLCCYQTSPSSHYETLKTSFLNPVNTERRTNVRLLLDHRLGCWPNIKPQLAQRPVFSGARWPIPGHTIYPGWNWPRSMEMTFRHYCLHISFPFSPPFRTLESQRYQVRSSPVLAFRFQRNSLFPAHS